MLTRYLVAVADPATRRLHVQLLTYDWREAVEVVLAMRAERPGVQAAVVSRRVWCGRVVGEG